MSRRARSSASRPGTLANRGRPAGSGAAPRRWLQVPPHASALSGWALLPLRAFLGFTFTFAGLQKLANPNFFNAASPSSIQAQLIAAERVSPLHFLLGHLLRFATPLGVVIALGELAVGIGTLLGLWTRLAALGGLVLSLMLFLTVSFHSSPYYTGADIVFLFAWTPLIVAGAGGILSVDAAVARAATRDVDLEDPSLVPVAFSVVRQVCGHFSAGRCRARGGAPCQMTGCPFLRAERDTLARRGPDELDRRTLVRDGAVAAAAGVAGLGLAGAAAGLGRVVGGAPAPGAGEATLGPPQTGNAGTKGSGGSGGGGTSQGGTVIGRASEVPVGGAASFTDPSSGDPSLVLRPSSDTFVAFDAVCPHAGCTVGYSSAAKLIVCPCHGSQFNPNTGAVEVGPAPRGLTPIKVTKNASGDLTVA